MSEGILIVEDNLALAENVAELLSEEARFVRIASDAAAAEALARTHGFDLALVDIRLTGMVSGLELVPRLRQHSAHGEIVLMTGEATLDTAIQAIRSGVYAYLTKPFSPDQLLSLSTRALAQVALKREKHALSMRLEASEALYRGVVEAVEACIVGLDADGIVRFVNRFMCERMERAASDLVGTPLLSLCTGDHAKNLARAMERAFRAEAVRDQECLLDTPRGPRTLRWTLSPLAARPDPEPAVALPVVLAVGIDITDRLYLEQKTAEAEAMAAMGVLTTGLAHEIRNPLNAAKLQIELLMRRARRVAGEAASHVTEPAQLVKGELDRLSALLEEFLDLARPRPLERRAFSVLALFESVRELEAPVVSAIGVAIEVRVTPPELTVRGDMDKLKQVVLNLVRNAVDALSERQRGTITLSAASYGEGVRLCVEDDGPGVPDDVAQRAFRPFVTSKPAGTGLGLSIVQKIVAQHGGHVELVPRDGGGTLARFVVPS